MLASIGGIMTVLYILLFPLSLDARRSLPLFLKPCENNQNLSRCSQQVLEDMRPHLVKGIPELNLQSIDPLRVDKISRTQRNSKIANYQKNMTNVEVTGARDFKVQDITIDPDSYAIRLKLAFPRLSFYCDAVVDGVILGFTVMGAGSVSVNYTNLVLDIVVSGEPYRLGGEKFIKWKKEDIEVGYGEAYFTDMHGFFEDPSVIQVLKMVANRSIRLLGTTMRAVIELSLGYFIVEAINCFHRVIPTDILYPVGP